MNTFTLDGRSTSEWGVGLSAGGAYDAPARKGETISIPGSNRSIWVDGGGWENIFITYPCWMSENLNVNIDDFRAFLSLHSGQFYELRDTYHPGEFRLARYSGTFTPQLGPNNKSGRFDVTFECQPLRYFDGFTSWIALSPEQCFQPPEEPGGAIEFVPNWTHENPSSFKTYPVIKIAGTPAVIAPPDTTGLQFGLATEDISNTYAYILGAISGRVYYVDFETNIVRSSTSDLGANWESAKVDDSVKLNMSTLIDVFPDGDPAEVISTPYGGGAFDLGNNYVLAVQDNLTTLAVIPRYATI